MRHWLFQPSTGVSGRVSSWAKKSTNGTNLGLFNISFLLVLASNYVRLASNATNQDFLRPSQNEQKIDLKQSPICPI